MPSLIALIMLFTFHSFALEMQEEIYGVREVNAMLWDESTILSEQYKKLKRKKK